MKKKPSKLAQRICRRYYLAGSRARPLWEIIDQEVAREFAVKFKKDKNGKIVVVKNGKAVGAQG